MTRLPAPKEPLIMLSPSQFDIFSKISSSLPDAFVGERRKAVFLPLLRAWGIEMTDAQIEQGEVASNDSDRRL